MNKNNKETKWNQMLYHNQRLYSAVCDVYHNKISLSFDILRIPYNEKSSVLNLMSDILCHKRWKNQEVNKKEVLKTFKEFSQCFLKILNKINKEQK